MKINNYGKIDIYIISMFCSACIEYRNDFDENNP